jgi:hypothetical protein
LEGSRDDHKGAGADLPCPVFTGLLKFTPVPRRQANLTSLLMDNLSWTDLPVQKPAWLFLMVPIQQE